MSARQVTGAPTFCWECMRQLQRAPGKGKGMFYAELVRDQDGVEHRVHGDCVHAAQEGGAKLVREKAAA